MIRGYRAPRNQSTVSPFACIHHRTFNFGTQSPQLGCIFFPHWAEVKAPDDASKFEPLLSSVSLRVQLSKKNEPDQPDQPDHVRLIPGPTEPNERSMHGCMMYCTVKDNPMADMVLISGLGVSYI